MSFPVLTALVLVPALGAGLVALLSAKRPEWTKLAAALTSVFTGALSIWALASFETADDGFQFVSKHSWIEQWGISWHLGLDGISLFLVVLTGVLFPLVIVGTARLTSSSKFFWRRSLFKLVRFKRSWRDI